MYRSACAQIYHLLCDGLHSYSDSSLADQTDDCHSTCGFVFLLANAAIGWASRKQRTVAQNTTEVEYMAMTDTSNQGVWYRSFLSELGYEVNTPIPLHCDNKGAVNLALNPVTGYRSKHIEIRHHVLHEYSELKHTYHRNGCRWIHQILTTCPTVVLQFRHGSIYTLESLDHRGMLRICALTCILCAWTW